MTHFYTDLCRVIRGVLCLCLLDGWPQTDRGLDYSDRGNRFEGKKQTPYASYDVEILSALVDDERRDPTIGDQLRIRFYLPREQAVYLTVRDIPQGPNPPAYAYWMDQIRPTTTWKVGFKNEFAWSSNDVIRKLNIKQLSQLGVIARLGHENPSPDEWVAPALFYSSGAPTKAYHYVFCFKTNAEARLRCTIYKEGSSKAVLVQSFPAITGKSPFTLEWNGANAADGWYRVHAHGLFNDTNEPLDLVVHFYHRAEVN
jgi:hypothetical protein